MTGTRRIVTLERFGPPEVMRWADAPVPERGADDVHVAVEAIGINFADTMVRRGEYRRDQPLDFTPGMEVAGTVVAAPDDGPPVGATVVVFCEHGGGYADAVVAPRDHVTLVPDGIDAVAAAGLYLQGVTAWYAMRRYGRVAEGDTVLVHAAAAEHGAVDGVLSDPDTLLAAVRELTGGRGADVVIDGVAGPVFAPSLRALAFGGRYVVAGAASQQAATLDVRALMPRGQTISGFVVRRVMDVDPSEPQRAFDEVAARFRDGRLRPAIIRRGADDLADIHRRIEARTLTGKVVVAL